MKISTKGRYALRMLVDLAIYSNTGYVALKDIAERQNVSKKYLEQIVPILNRTDILLTNRGYQGGYKLGRSASKITVEEVLRLTEGGMEPVACINQDGSVSCDRQDMCPTLPVWVGLNKVISEYLSKVTIQDLVEQMPGANSDNYSI